MLSTEDIIVLWLKSKESYVKESTLAQYKRTFYKTLIKDYAISDMRILNTDKQQELIDSLSKKYSTQTLKNTTALLNHIFEFAYKKRYTDFPIVLMTVQRNSKVSKPAVLNIFEQKVLTSYLLNNIDFSKLGVLLCLYAGLRLGEICGLQWKDFDFVYQTIKIRKTVQRISNGSGYTYFLISTPKTQCSEREIPMPDFLIKYFDQNGICVNPESYVVTGTESFMQPRTYQNRLKSYLKKCGLPAYHFHTLRHTFASRAVELGFDIKALSEVLGHSNTKITLDLYVHPSMELKKREMQKFSAMI